MLTRLIIQQLKQFDEIDIPLGQTVAFVGANNSGKTTALQALALWHIGVQTWAQKRRSASKAKERIGVTINRKDLIAMPVPNANLLWRNLRTRDVQRAGNKPKTQNIRIKIIVEGVQHDKLWQAGMEFDYANTESLYCRPLKLGSDSLPSIPPEAIDTRVAFLPPMSGLAAVEPRIDLGRIHVLIGEGRTAEVLRNLCYHLYDSDKASWDALVQELRVLFGIRLKPPNYVSERGEITMSYVTQDNIELNIASAGSGMQQTLLLLAYLRTNPHTTLLLDEPDTHLEILRQRQTYQLLSELTKKQNSQLILASHSEIVLDEAAQRDSVIAFVGKPHVLMKADPVKKALTSIGFDQYYQAEQTGWVLYLEGATDLAILQAFARISNNQAAQAALARPFVKYLGNNRPSDARSHFHALKEATPRLIGIALFDRLDQHLHTEGELVEMMWEQREIENYFCFEDVFIAYATQDIQTIGADGTRDMFGEQAYVQRAELMRACIEEVVQSLETLGKPALGSSQLKASNEFIEPLLKLYHKKLGTPLLLHKGSYHTLVEFVPPNQIAPEVHAKLNAIADVARRAHSL